MDMPFFFDRIMRAFRGPEKSKYSSDRLKGPHSRRLQIEPLEDRTLLAFCYVDANATGTGGNGTSWNTAYKTLQEALEAAAAPGSNITEIWVAKGTYTPTPTFQATDPRSATFSLVNGVSIYGGFAGNESSKNARAMINNEYVHQTILSGDLGRNDNLSNPDTIRDNAYTVLSGSGLSATMVIEGLTITGGNADTVSGGGVALSHCSNVTLDKLNITGNNASNGAGVFIVGGSVTIKGCSITENFASNYGGGVHFGSGTPPGTLKVESSVIANNAANSGGGGLYQAAGTINVSASHFSGNTGLYGAGLLQEAKGIGTITYSSFLSNVAPNRYSTQGQGGGVCQFGEMNISYTTFANNVAGLGGGIFFSNNADSKDPKSPSTYSNLTISQNVGRPTDNRVTSGGIYIVSGLLNLNASIVAGNTATANPDIFGEREGVDKGDPKSTLVLCGSNNVIGVGTGIPEIPTGEGSPSFAVGKTIIANNSQGNQVGTIGSPLNPKVGDPTGETNKVTFVLPLLAGSPALGKGTTIGVVASATAERSGQTYVVRSLEDKISTGSELLTFRAAFEAANSNIAVGNAPAGSFTQTDVITFAEGVTGTIYLNGKALTVYGGLTISGWTAPHSSNVSSPGAMNYLAIDAGHRSSVIKVIGNVNVRLSEITLLGGYSPVNGGGMVAYSSNITLNKVAIRDSHSLGQEGGGGFYARNATLNATDIIVSGCTAAVAGGGMLLNATEAIIVGASIYQNRAKEEGGGIFMTNPIPAGKNSVISNATFAQNRSSRGAGLAILNTSVRLAHLTVTKNVGEYSGGIMVGVLAKVQMYNSIVADNFSYISPDIEIYYNNAGDPNNAVLQGAFNLIGNGTGQNSLVNNVNGNIVGTVANPINPRFAGPSYYNGQLIYPLLSSSRAVDAGNSDYSRGNGSTVLVYDVRGKGYDRIAAKTGNELKVDMGACEFQPNLVGSIQAPQGTTVLLGQELDFKGIVVPGSNAAQKFLWDFNNNGVFGEIVPWATQGDEFGEIVRFLSEGIIPPLGSGLYPIRLILEDSSGRRSEPFELEIRILSEAPTFTIYGKTTFNAREANYWEIVAENTQYDPIMRWEIHWGNGFIDVINGGPRNRIFIYHLYTATGTYDFTVKTVSLFGDKREFSLKFNVQAKPAPSLAAPSPVMEIESVFTPLVDEILPIPSSNTTPTTQQAAYQRFWEEADPDTYLSSEKESVYDIATLDLYERVPDRVIANWNTFDEVLVTERKKGLFSF